MEAQFDKVIREVNRGSLRNERAMSDIAHLRSSEQREADQMDDGRSEFIPLKQ